MSGSLFYFEDLEVGQQWLSEERVVAETDVALFADLTGDHNPIHVDPEFAQSTPFRRCIAHGLLGLSMAAGLHVSTARVNTIAFVSLIDWQFRAPVFFGDKIRVLTRVLEKQVRSRGRRGLVTWQLQVFNQSALIVQQGRSVTLVGARAASERCLIGTGSLPPAHYAVP